MAHEIDTTTGKAAMAYRGDRPWHGLGQQLKEGATIDEWTVSAGLNFECMKVNVEFTVDSTKRFAWTERNVLFRSDTLHPLSVVSSDYRVVQPRQVMDFFRALSEKSKATMETAGALYGGRVIWALARLQGDTDVMDDKIAPYLMLSTSYDMSTPTVAKMVATRVVCANTIAIALNETGQRQVKIPHSTDFNPDEVRMGMEISFNEYEKFIINARKLAARPFSKDEMDAYLIKLLSPAKGEVDPEVVRKSKTFQIIMDMFNGTQIGADQDAVKGTAWGALNAATQYIDHIKGRNQNARLLDAWFQMGAKFKERALDLVLAG